ncbi:hypothetical protein A3Q56_08434, partial [Intoshia linei]
MNCGNWILQGQWWRVFRGINIYWSWWTIIWHYIKWPVESMRAEVVARKIYEKLIPRYGVRKCIHTDMGTQFKSELIRELCEMYGIVKTETRPYHHEGVGAVEKLNRTLKNMLRVKKVGRFDKNWENFIPEILVAIRNRQSCATGYSPSVLVYGKNLDLNWNIKYVGDVVRPSENQIGENSKKYREMMEKNHNSNVTRSLKFKKTYCYCKRGEVENDFSVECDSCKDWFHGDCVKWKTCEKKGISRVKRQIRVPQKFDNYEMENIKNKGNLRCINGRKVVVKNNLLDIDDLRKIFKVLEPQYACNTDGKITLIEFDKLNSREQYSKIPMMLLTLNFGKYDDALFETK